MQTAGERAGANHYVRFARDEQGDVLMIGGEDHKTGQAEDCEQRFAKLERWTRDRFPFLGEMTDHWSGQVLEPVDGLAYIGRNPGNKNVYIVTGDSGNGITHGTLAGMVVVGSYRRAGKSLGELVRSIAQDIEAASARRLHRRECKSGGAISRLRHTGFS